HAGGERAGGARGDRRVQRPLRRQPRRPQAARGGDRRAHRALARGEPAMRARRFEWEGAAATAAALREWSAALAEPVDLGPIRDRVLDPGSGRARDDEVLALTNRFDATERPLRS